MPENGKACPGVVRVAREGFGKGGDKYDRYRPSFNDSAVDLILEQLDLSPESTFHLDYEILELGAGTGKFTETLVPKVPQNTRYVAVDPSTNFLKVLRAKCLPIDIAVGTASAISLPDCSVQNIICANCFHWFSNAESLQEMHRVLVPGGKLVLIWNTRTHFDGWMEAFEKQRLEVVERVGAAVEESYHSMKWCKAIDSSPLFSIEEHHSLPGDELRSTVDQFIATTSTLSAYNALPEAERVFYLEKLKNAILAYPDVNSDALIMPLMSEIYIYHSESFLEKKNRSMF